MALSAEQEQQLLVAYGDAVRALLPDGRLFAGGVGPNLAKILLELARSLTESHAVIEAVRLEANPATALAMLPEWESATGLPDECSGPLANTQARRAAVVVRAGWNVPFTRAGLESLAGYMQSWVEPRELNYTHCQAACEGLVGSISQGWHYTLLVRLPRVSGAFFTVGESSVGEPLSSYGSEPIRCAIQRVAPAHVRVLFVEDGPQVPPEYQPWGWRIFPATVGCAVSALPVGE